MSELRWHPFLEEWVITATHRQDRTFLPPKDYCPLCPTQPGGFPTEVPRDDYDIVVFENKFPSLQRVPPEREVESSPFSPGKSAYGRCEVVLSSPEHTGSLSGWEASGIQHLTRRCQDRYRELDAADT